MQMVLVKSAVEYLHLLILASSSLYRRICGGGCKNDCYDHFYFSSKVNIYMNVNIIFT